MRAELKRSSLSPARQRLVELMSEIGFGRIEGLPVRAGEPVLNASLRVFREVSFGKGQMPRTRPVSDDFALKQEVLDLFSHLDGIGDGRVSKLELRHGLPVRLHIQDSFEPSETEE